MPVLQVIPWADIYLLHGCLLGFVTEEPEHTNYDMDVHKHREYYLKVYDEMLFSDDSPQVALWDNKKQKVGTSDQLYSSTDYLSLD